LTTLALEKTIHIGRNSFVMEVVDVSQQAFCVLSSFTASWLLTVKNDVRALMHDERSRNWEVLETINKLQIASQIRLVMG
jgi:hypothetical protein